MSAAGSSKDVGIILHPPLDLLRILYESRKGEWTLIGSDGFPLKFDQAVLAAQVPHFRTIFSHKQTVECKTKMIQVPAELEMNKEDVDAFLRFIYYKDTSVITKSCRTTCALIRAGHYYDVPELVENGGKLMRGKNRNWYDLDEIWKLYHHVRLWEETHRWKKTLIQQITGALEGIFKNEKDPDKLLKVTDGNHALRDFIVDIVKNNYSVTHVERNASDENHLESRVLFHYKVK